MVFYQIFIQNQKQENYPPQIRSKIFQNLDLNKCKPKYNSKEQRKKPPNKQSYYVLQIHFMYSLTKDRTH